MHAARIARRLTGLVLILAAPCLARGQRPGATGDTVSSVPVSGLVYDSIAAQPLAGAAVQLADSARPERSYTARTDSTGRFLIPNVRPGMYIAGFFHPAVDALGIEPPLRLVAVPGTGQPVTLAIPGAAPVMHALCGTQAPGDSAGALAGVVLDADSGVPVPGAAVILTWNDLVIGRGGLHTERRRVPVRTRDDGAYTVCGLPGDDDIIATAQAGNRRTGLVQVHVPSRAIARRDFTLGDSAAAVAVHADSSGDTPASTVLRGSARLAGTVRAPNGRPVPNARIVVWGTGLTASTGSDGRFALSGLPAGTFSIEARALGFTPKLAPVDLSSGVTRAVALAFDQPATQLSRVTIYGQRSPRARDIGEFLERSAHGMGYYLTANDLERRSVLTVSEALRTTPGLHVVPAQGFGYAVLGRGNCTPVVYVDGMQIFEGNTSLDMLVQPTQVAGIEVYTGLGGAPPQYQSNGCGTILVWTKR